MIFPPVDAASNDSVKNKSILESDQKPENTENAEPEEGKKKKRSKEKIGFRDRKVRW